jgi:hypothetical protein
MEAVLEQCLVEIAEVKKKGEHPINIGTCQNVMGSVTQSFEDEYVQLFPPTVLQIEPCQWVRMDR